MPMSRHVAREGHVILRTVLVALSIIVLAVCVLMWWVTASTTSKSIAAEGSGPSAGHALASNTDAQAQ
jgi:hypothetical protein